MLVSLEVASPEYGKAIACLLTGKATRGKNKKVDVCPAIPKKKFAGYKGAIGSIARAITMLLISGIRSVSRMVYLILVVY